MKDEFEGFVAPPTTLGKFNIIATRDTEDGGADFIFEGDGDTNHYFMNEGFIFMLVKGIFGFTTSTLMDFLEETRGIQPLNDTRQDHSDTSVENVTTE